MTFVFRQICSFKSYKGFHSFFHGRLTLLGLYLGCKVQFELVFAYTENCGLEFIILQGGHPVAQYHLVERLLLTEYIPMFGAQSAVQ